MPWLTATQAKELARQLEFKSESARTEWQTAIQQAEADDVRAGTTMLTASAQGLSDQHDKFSSECIEVADGFEAVAEMAARPDSDFRAVLKVYQDLEARARALSALKESWGQRVDEHNVRVADPAAYAESIRKRWADKCLTSRDRFLHQFPPVG